MSLVFFDETHMGAVIAIVAVGLFLLCTCTSFVIWWFWDKLPFGKKNAAGATAASAAAETGLLAGTVPMPPAPAVPAPAVPAPASQPAPGPAAAPAAAPAGGPAAAAPAPAGPAASVVAAPKAGGRVIAQKARTSYYNPGNNDPPGSRACAYKNPCTAKGEASPSSAAHAARGGSPYTKGGLYTISGAGMAPFCVRIDDTCAACTGDHIDVFLNDGQKLPFDYATVTEGC